VLGAQVADTIVTVFDGTVRTVEWRPSVPVVRTPERKH
jgi:hypothetical protein